MRPNYLFSEARASLSLLLASVTFALRASTATLSVLTLLRALVAFAFFSSHNALASPVFVLAPERALLRLLSYCVRVLTAASKPSDLVISVSIVYLASARSLSVPALLTLPSVARMCYRIEPILSILSTLAYHAAFFVLNTINLASRSLTLFQ